MFTLTDDHGHLVLMRSGEPFTYTSRNLARIGQRLLSKQLDKPVHITNA